MAPTFSIRPQNSSTKRSWSPGTPNSKPTTPVLEFSKETGGQVDISVPEFLRQSNTEIHSKFDELEWLQQFRISEGNSAVEASSDWAVDNRKEAKLRNRYGNVQAWAKSRIHLKVPEGACDYINASPISILNSKTGVETKYIAAQGPKQIGLSHFWQMIWHETTTLAVIVMLTQTVESGREKCFQYFPLGPHGEGLRLSPNNEADDEANGSIRLMDETYDESSKTTIRKLLLTFGEETKTVWHLLYTSWLDFGVPEDENREALIELINLSKLKNDNLPENPRIIHCSAGVGRSGTFIALEHLLSELELGSVAETKDSEDMIYETVNKLRKQRMMMVQSAIQYRFLYDVLREQFLKFEKEKRQKEVVAAAAAAAAVIAAEKLPLTGTGEPSPKVMRLAKGIKAAFLRDRSRPAPPLSPRAGKSEHSSSEGKAPSNL